MTFGDRLAYARKQKVMRQADLGKLVGTSGDIIGKYERGDAVPSIEAAKKIADAFGVSLDYLVGEGQNASFDKANLKRLQDVQKLSSEDKAHVFALLDAFLLKVNIQKNLAR